VSPIVDTSARVMRLGARLAVDSRAITADGIGHVPAAGPVVLAVRHYHHLLDGLGLLAQLARPLHIMIGLDWVQTAAGRRLMEALARGCAWPVTLRDLEDRRDEEPPHALRPSAYASHEIQPYQQRAFRQCVELLGQGRAVAIFPEGYPVIDPHTRRRPRADILAPFKSGFARVAVAAARRQGSPVPVVPVGIRADPHDRARLAFGYGPPRQVAPGTDVQALIADVRHDVGLLSS
jgi:putative membrane protein